MHESQSIKSKQIQSVFESGDLFGINTVKNNLKWTRRLKIRPLPVGQRIIHQLGVKDK